jgi:hypothetical protein
MFATERGTTVGQLMRRNAHIREHLVYLPNRTTHTRIPSPYSMDAEGLTACCLRCTVKAAFEDSEANGAKYNLGGRALWLNHMMKPSYVAWSGGAGGQS